MKIKSDGTRKYISRPKVRARYNNVSDMTVWRWERDPAMGFPKPYFFGRFAFYAEEELEAFERSRPRSKTTEAM